MPTESGKPLIVISYAHADEPENPAEGEVTWLSSMTGRLGGPRRRLTVRSCYPLRLKLSSAD